MIVAKSVPSWRKLIVHLGDERFTWVRTDCTRAVYGLPGSHWFMAFSSILVIYGKQLELDGS